MNNLLIYQAPSKWPLVAAFVAAVIIHLGAVALASRRGYPVLETTASVSDVIGVELTEEPATAPPEIEPLPPPPVSDPEFVEEKFPPPPLPAYPGKPFHPIAPARPAVASGRALAINAPRPDYPYEARRRRLSGSDVVALTLGATGSVVDATMEQSTGSAVLDQSALSAFSRWRFKAGTPARVRVPITFTLSGVQF